jgi:hypothetical protein
VSELGTSVSMVITGRMPTEKASLRIANRTGIPVDLFAATEDNWWNYLVCRTGPADSNAHRDGRPSVRMVLARASRAVARSAGDREERKVQSEEGTWLLAFQSRWLVETGRFEVVVEFQRLHRIVAEFESDRVVYSCLPTTGLNTSSYIFVRPSRAWSVGEAAITAEIRCPKLLPPPAPELDESQPPLM